MRKKYGLKDGEKMTEEAVIKGLTMFYSYLLEDPTTETLTAKELLERLISMEDKLIQNFRDRKTRN